MTDLKASTVMMSVNESAPASPKKATKGKKPRAKPSHPRTADMVIGAIKALQERSGSSLQAIKKYITSTYKVDAEKQAPFIKRYLKAAVADGNLVQTKGKGAAGSFKLAGTKNEGSKVKKGTVNLKSPALKKTPSRPIAKKVVKKIVKKSAKKPGKAAAEKKKTTKGPAAKPPKAKTAAKAQGTAKGSSARRPVVLNATKTKKSAKKATSGGKKKK